MQSVPLTVDSMYHIIVDSDIKWSLHIDKFIDYIEDELLHNDTLYFTLNNETKMIITKPNSKKSKCINIENNIFIRYNGK